MDIEALIRSPVGQLIPIQGTDARHGPFACFAFLPHPLPDQIPPLNPTTWTSVTEAASALARLDQACGQLANPGLLINPALYREALDTSALEGTYGQLADVLEAELPGSHFPSPEVAEIQGYVRIARWAFEEVKKRPITVGLLSEIQNGLFRDAADPPRDLGRVRKHQVWIGPKDSPIDKARFVPPPGDDRLQAGMDAWEQWVGIDHALPAILLAALAHYQIETLHPFGDGNGRIGRLVIVLQLLRAGAISSPAVTVSPWFLERRDQYQEKLLRVSSTGDWDSWVQFFCAAIVDQCGSLVRGAEQLTTWLHQTRAELNRNRWTGEIYHLVDRLTEWPVISIAFVANTHNVTAMTATRMVNHLQEIGVLRELTGRSYGRVFGAVEVMRIVDEI
jgi:Fic family protein